MSTPPTIANSTYMASVYQTLVVFGYFCIALGNNATSIYNSVSGLTPPDGYSFGRYFAQPGNPAIPYAFSTSSVETMIAQSVVLRADLATALSTLIDDAEGQFAAGPPVIPIPQIYASVTALAACYADPADQITGMSILAQFEAPSFINPATVGLDQIGCQILQLCNRTATRIRIAALLQLATAISQYQPTSQNDACNVQASAALLFDREMAIQSNYFDNASYQTLKASKLAMTQDMKARGSTLQPVVELGFNKNYPSLALAYRLYQSIDLEPDLVARNNPIHPGFMPTTIECLAK